MLPKLFSVSSFKQYCYAGEAVSSPSDSYGVFEFRELSANDFLNHAIFSVKNRAQRYLSHLKNGHRCFGFQNKTGEVVSYFWLSIASEDRTLAIPFFKGADWLLSPTEAYIWDCRTDPAYYRRGLYRAGLKRLIAMCQQQHVSRIMMSAELKNYASNAGIMSAGFVLCGAVRLLRVGVFKFVFCQHKKPKLSRLLTPLLTSDVFPVVL